MTSAWVGQFVHGAAWVSSVGWGRRARRGALREGAGAGGWKHEDWNALLRRFVQNGEVDYANFTRVRRIVEVFLDRISDARPDSWSDADEQLAFYLNAYNAIMIHQVIVHWPVRSVRDIPAVFARPYPVGRQNMSLLELLHSKIRMFGDPRVHMAVVRAARGSPRLQPYAYTGQLLQPQLAESAQQFLADQQRGLRYNPSTHTLHLGATLRYAAGDWADPAAMPSSGSLIHGLLRPQIALAKLLPLMPPAVQTALARTPKPPKLVFMPYDWSINGPDDKPS